ncbi:MAG: benzoate-CoA ligase family protein [Verrucomicrobia bacterium]|nr:benzoate-CoA ligase family protein [Verrucomicrobiota bacterium]
MSVPELPEQLNAVTVLVDSHGAAGRADKPAILSGDEVVTYGELAENVNRVGNALRALGVRIEQRVAILMRDCPECVYAFFGAMKIGAVPIPINTVLGAKDYEYILNDSRAHVLIVEPDLLGHVMEIRAHLDFLEHIVVGGHGDGGPLVLHTLMAKASPKLEAAKTTKDDAAFWLYSSGTTGYPKGTVHLHHDMIVSADAYARDTIGMTEDDVVFSVAKLFFAYGLGNGLYFPMRIGGTTVLLPERPLADKAFEMVDRYQPTVFFGVPTSYASMLHLAEKTGRTRLGRVRMCVSAGEPLPKPLFEKWKKRFGIEILDGIGSTEILHIFISNRPGKTRPGSTGQIVPGYEAMIVDDDGKELPPGHTGTLLIKGESVAAGYWNKHEQTKETFRGEWINTHDKFSMDEDGYYWYSGRTDDMFKVSGLAVWPSDVEHVLQEHPAVLESGVIGVLDDDGLTKVRAYVALKDSHAPTEELVRELQAFVKSNTAPHKYPRSIVFVKELPKTASGKIQRYKLRKMAAAHGGKPHAEAVAHHDLSP